MLTAFGTVPRMIDQRSRPDALPARDDAAALRSAGGDVDLARELLDALLAGLPAELQELPCLHRRIGLDRAGRARASGARCNPILRCPGFGRGDRSLGTHRTAGRCRADFRCFCRGRVASEPAVGRIAGIAGCRCGGTCSGGPAFARCVVSDLSDIF